MKEKIYLWEKLNSIDVDVIDHGVVFNFEEKQKIFNQCNYGLNIMKSQVCVGLT